MATASQPMNVASEFNDAEQRLLDQAQNYSAQVIHGGASDSIIARLNVEDPVEGLATVAAELTAAVENVIEENIGQEIPEGILPLIGRHIVNELIGIALEAGIFEENQAEDIASRGFIEATRVYTERKQQEGGVSEQRQQLAQQDVALLQKQPGQGQGQPQAQGQEQPPPKNPGRARPLLMS